MPVTFGERVGSKASFRPVRSVWQSGTSDPKLDPKDASPAWGRRGRHKGFQVRFTVARRLSPAAA